MQLSLERKNNQLQLNFMDKKYLNDGNYEKAGITPLPEPAENPGTVDFKTPIYQIKRITLNPESKDDVTNALRDVTKIAKEFYSFLQILKLIYQFFWGKEK